MLEHRKWNLYLWFGMETILNILYWKVFIRILISRFIRVLKVYMKIYRDTASPLLYHTQNLFQRLKHYTHKKLNAYSVPFILCVDSLEFSHFILFSLSLSHRPFSFFPTFVSYFPYSLNSSSFCKINMNWKSIQACGGRILQQSLVGVGVPI